ncbi:hypothetical protein [Pelobium manganitolerans]|uniref:hypothetical protein n=1 Tax=Pelobium manganitolerans TaxID=1842495 RepID=UPI003FA3AC87
MKYLILLLMFFTGLGAFAQQEPPIAQFSGVIYDKDSNSVVPYVTIRNITEGKNYSANYKGYFSFVVHEGDSILFTAVGYKKLALNIPKNLTNKKFTALIKLKADNIELPTVTIFPWASIDEFNKDFLTMKFADDDLEIAKKNLSKESLRDLYMSLPRDGAEYNTNSFQYNHNKLNNSHMVYTNPLLNPLAWGALIKQITEGNKSRDKK